MIEFLINRRIPKFMKGNPPYLAPPFHGPATAFTDKSTDPGKEISGVPFALELGVGLLFENPGDEEFLCGCKQPRRPICSTAVSWDSTEGMVSGLTDLHRCGAGG